MNFLQTKIVATIGPKSSDYEIIKDFIRNHVRVFRMNFSHVNYDRFKKNIELIRQASIDLSIEVSILADLQGPKIRTGDLKSGEVEIQRGQKIGFTPDEVLGTSERISVSYPTLHKDVKTGNRILVDDGSLEFEVEEIIGTDVICRAKNGGSIFPKKGVNLPNIGLNTPALTDKDLEDLDFILANDFDFIALSFVRSKEDILVLKRKLSEKNGTLPIIAKIEKPEAVDNFDGILSETIGVMLARGDLGVEVEPNLVPIIQKKIIKKCRNAGKPIIVATQMLTSMVHNPLPTRAEANDVANAVYDGADAVMLSNETAMGEYPRESVKMMSKIIESVEENHFKENWQKKNKKILQPSQSITMTEMICRSAIRISCDIEAKMIVSITHSGNTCQQISRYRPGIPIFAVTKNMKTVRRLILSWGVQSWRIEKLEKTDETFDKIFRQISKLKFLKKNDHMIFIAGIPTLSENSTNMLTICKYTGENFVNPF